MPASRTLWRTVAQLKGRGFTYVLAMVVAVSEAAAMLTFPLVQRAFYDRILIAGQTDLLAPVLLSMLGLVVTMIASKVGAAYLFASVSEGVKLEVRTQLAQQAYSRPLVHSTGEATGELLSVATNDVDAMGELYRSVIGHGVVYVLWLTGTLVVLAVIDPRLLLVAFPLLAVYALLPLGITPGLRRTGGMVQEKTAKLVATLQEGFSGIRDIKAFGRVGWGVMRQREAGNLLREAELRRTRFELAALGSFVVYWVSVVGISWYGAIAVSENRLTVGSLLALLLYFGQLQLPVSSLVRVNNELQAGLAGSERVFAQLDRAPSARGGNGGRSAATGGGWPQEPRISSGTVTVQNVCVRYPGHGLCLDNVSVHAGAGEFVAVVGETGSGKTTLLNAILGFVDAEQGHVLVDGHRLADISDADLRRRISVSSSEAVLFDMTIADNIRFGELETSDDEVRAAARASAADGFIRSLPEGYETRIGERGGRLSTGQRQRVVLARALVRQPSILLLDEATSGLDGPTERLVLDNLLNQPDRPTIVMVTHRLHALGQADLIYVLDGGRVVEQGDHHTLLGQAGLYHRLCRRQGLAAKPGQLLANGDPA